MKKITSLFFILISLQLPNARAIEPQKCPVPAESLDPLDSKNSKSIEVLEAQVRISACNNENVFYKMNSPQIKINHNKLHCSEIELCLGDNKNEDVVREATESLNENLPKAVLLGVLDREIKDKIKYNVQIKLFEESHHQKVCPAEKIELSCEKDVRSAISSVSGSFIGYPGLDSGPDSNESIESFLSKKLLSGKDIKKITKSKEELSRSCSSEKINFTKICKLRDARLKEISDCEKNPQSKGCLDLEQNAMASLLDSQKNNKPAVFLAMEKQLCVSTRLVQDSPTQLTKTPPTILGGLKNNGSHFGLRLNSRMALMPPKQNEDAKEDSKIETKADSIAYINGPKTQRDHEGDDNTGNAPDARGVIGTEALTFDVSRAPASNEKETEDIKGFNTKDNSTLSESFSKSLSDSINTSNKTLTNSIPNTNTTNNWNTDLTSRFNTITEEDSKKKARDAIAEDSSVNAADKKKKEAELSALTAQINGMKTKLEEMNQNVDDLKGKKDTANVDKTDKDSLEREKSILDLKKKLADLEADKKKMQAEALAKTQEEEKARARDEAVRVAIKASSSIIAKRSDTEQSDISKRENEKSGNNNQSSGSFSESRLPASVSSSQAASTGAGIVLHSAGTQATPESSVVYMTAGEFQKYPYHLNDNASSGEIEKMLIVNKGASIILGNSEQIIPVVLNGVIQLDENGHVKFKKVKISLVKNERERKQSVAREISSIADLKREDQKMRELIRYQEMKNLIKDATK
ncbi:MAG: hypothetical protein H7281_11705 [Bacteriovorax sp.]|nr:hypothetical protein [Bacteriovorax sp.]